MQPKINDVATKFMLFAVQEWGHPESDRVAAVQGVLDAAGFEAIATCSPVFGGIWPKPCSGKDGERASAWLKNMTDTMKHGRVQDEIEHVERSICRALTSTD